ncbi:MAG: AmmeMemoRadiSam system radical SAM enzyme, partial [Candidatus Schekmanbacteria bacterium RBG_13_48_7]
MNKYSRRKFFGQTAVAGSLLFVPNISAAPLSMIFQPGAGDNPENNGFHGTPALYYKKLDHKKIQCELCPKKCEVADLERGYCGVRENQQGSYYTLVHSRPCAMHIDPIEKKPFFHFLPGTTALSLATAGCNMNCKFCQNWDISQVRPEQVKSFYSPPEKLVEAAKENGCKSISYTYSEPVIFYEYMLDTAKLTKNTKIKSTVVSNGYINEEPLKELCRYIDAMKVDLKAFNDTFYKDICSGTLKPVLESLKILVQQKVWTEIVYLVIPKLNDDLNDIKNMSK